MVAQFSKTFLLDYYFEEVQKLKFVVYDIDNAKHVDDTKRHDLIGALECTLADVVAAGQQYKRNLRDKGHCTHHQAVACNFRPTNPFNAQDPLCDLCDYHEPFSTGHVLCLPCSLGHACSVSVLLFRACPVSVGMSCVYPSRCH